MNKIFSNIMIAASAAGMLLGTASCNDELDLKPIDYPGMGSFWSSEAEFTTNIYAMSSMFRANYPGDILFWAGELRSGTLTIDLINGSGALNQEYINNNYDFSHTQFSNFGNYPGFIAVLNELIYECDRVSPEVLSDNVKNGLLGIAHGWRAYVYFQMYKMYGGVPLRDKPDVVLGETNPDVLRMPRSTAEETLTFIKDDITKSLNYFNESTYQLNSHKQYYWSKACTEMLAGEVYLWSAKVSTDDHKAGGASEVATAKGYFENVMNNYGYGLMDNYFDIWTEPRNKEVIYSICYSSEEDSQQFSGIQGQMVWSKAAGAGTVAWSKQDALGLGLRTDGAVSRFGYFTDSPTAKQAQYTCWSAFTPSPNRYMYKNALYFQFDEQDGRRDMFFPQWKVRKDEEALTYIANFDEKAHDLMGSFVLKYRPSIVPTWSSNYVWNNDATIYRLALVYTYLAEIANYEGDNPGVEKYINLIRKRAYGSRWDEATLGYKAGSFRENEAAILMEKNKEFIMEGQRWWDLRRMTVKKDGEQTDHLAFQPEGCVGFGLNPVENQWLKEQNGQAVRTVDPVLSTTEAYKLLWPIDQQLIGSDPTIKQNPGYEVDDEE